MNDLKENPNLAAVISQVEGYRNGQSVSTDNILMLCVNAMQAVEKLPTLTADQKKSLVVEALTSIATKEGINPAIIAIIPTFIDIANSIYTGAIDFVEKEVESVNCCCGGKKS
jgi:hypothetical protein